MQAEYGHNWLNDRWGAWLIRAFRESPWGPWAKMSQSQGPNIYTSGIISKRGLEEQFHHTTLNSNVIT